MNTEQFFVWFLTMLNPPFVALLVMLYLVFDALKLAQQGGKMEISNIFKDEAGKESGLRVAILGAWALSSWYLMADLTLQKSGNAVLFAIYLATWSGAPVFVRALEKWDGKLPTKGST